MNVIVSLLEQEQIDFTPYKRPEVIMVLKRKFQTQKEWMITSFNQYKFSDDEAEKVQQAILNGDLRITDLLKRPFSHNFWSFLTFKWGEILAGGKRLSKQEVLQIATCSSKGQEFSRTPTQNRNRLLKGVPLVVGKVVTSMALCMVFGLGLLATLGAPFGFSLALAIVLSLCNGIVCLLSRGRAMLDSAGFQPQKQKTFTTPEENAREKTVFDRGEKLFFGIVTLLACISAGISGYAGLVGLLTFLGAGMLASNPLVLIVTVGLSLITAISFYSFQAVGIRENYAKFKNLFIEDYKKPHGLLRCVLLGVVSAVFLAVYATLTWFTTASGVNKFFGVLGAKPDTFLAHVISMICTTTTMVVNTFSQVYKVFNPKTYVDLKEKFESIYQPSDESQTRAQKIKNGAINILKLCALIGDSLAYSVAGGIRSGIHVGETLGEAIGQKIALTVTMAILSPVILAFVSIAFTWPTVFNRRQSSPPSSQVEAQLRKMSSSPIPDIRPNNTLLPISEKSPQIKQGGLRFFDANNTLNPNAPPTIGAGAVLTSSTPS
ncbi:hypothetical protein [Legionella hackeliae]|uniref:Uncharacterized protein n=1 Tax=Legionella hackeliae TaxID=449 RepID=A0A0A8URE6_LEGHA|nr:hypothetical protein [Legionella hackeliae]KTD10127.1 hypothetical protein Lhac_2495 [Legionella hackeliae]CEK09617.1 conserved membrane protein of unknown function [Legionella hackeliae]STX49532.1 Uncharacterised protein [Legionella hackeliae]